LTITIYGISNCDTVAKARRWMEGRSMVYAFHDYKKGGITIEKLTGWVDAAGLDKVLNKGGTTFKKLAQVDKGDLDEAKAVALMADNPSLIKRPIVEKDGVLAAVGFKPSEWENIL